MCPACYAATAILITETTAAGGLTAFVAAKVYKKRRAAKLAPVTEKFAPEKSARRTENVHAIANPPS